MNSRRLAGFCVALCLAFTAVVSARAAPPLDGPLTVQAALPVQPARVGDQIPLRVEVAHHHETQVIFPDLADKLGAAEVVRRQSLPSTRQPDGTQRSRMEYVISVFAPGRYTLPRISVEYLLPNGIQGTAQTPDDLILEVASVLQDSNEPLRDVKAPSAIPRPTGAYLRPLSIVALVVGGVGLFLVLTRRWLLRRRPLIPLPVLDPDAVARTELSRVASLPLHSGDDYARFYAAISTTIRRYLDARFDLRAMSSTTAELRRRMEHNGFDSWQARLITGLLQECDSVKWAHYRPDPARAGRALTNAMEIVELISRPGPREQTPHDSASPAGPSLAATRR